MLALHGQCANRCMHECSSRNPIDYVKEELLHCCCLALALSNRSTGPVLICALQDVTTKHKSGFTFLPPGLHAGSRYTAHEQIQHIINGSCNAGIIFLSTCHENWLVLNDAAGTVDHVMILTLLIRCLRMRLHPELDDKPCASSDGPEATGVLSTGKQWIWWICKRGLIRDSVKNSVHSLPADSTCCSLC